MIIQHCKYSPFAKTVTRKWGKKKRRKGKKEEMNERKRERDDRKEQ